MKKLYICVCFLLFIYSPVHAGEIVDISPDIEKLLENSLVPSLSVAAVVDGKIIAAGAAGIRKKGSPEKVRLTDKYHIGSCTKSMTATLAAILIAEGKNTWDTTIGQVFEGFKIHPDYRKVSVRQLLTNTGGTPVDIDSILWSELWKAEGTLTDQRLQLLKGIISNPPKYPPGTKYEYSNAGYSIAGALLEKVTGDSFENLLKEKLFDPLGMSSAGFRAPAENGKVTQPYGHIKKWFRVTPTDAEPGGDNPAAIAPAGAVHSSVLDLARYAQFHLGTVGKEILSKKQRAVLYKPTIHKAYAMGWIVTERRWANGKALTHAGSNTMFYTVIWLEPERNFGAIAMSNYGAKEGFEKCDQAIAYLIQKYLK